PTLDRICSPSRSMDTKLRTRLPDNASVFHSVSCLRAITAVLPAVREPHLQSAKPKKTVLVIVGMPGAGKSLASSVMNTRGIPVFDSGDIIRAEARKRKLKFTRKNLGELMLKIRKEEGMGAVAKRLVPLVEKANG